MPQKKFYLTKKGIKKIKEGLKELKKQRLVLLSGSGPRSFRFGETEADYFVFREDLGRLEEKIQELENVLENYEIIKIPLKKDQDRVYLGARVSIELDGVLEEFKIVGTLESDPANKQISDESPIGKALLGKRVGEEALIETPMLNHRARILKIKYAP